MSLYVPYVCRALGGQTVVLDPLEMELQAVVNPGPLQDQQMLLRHPPAQ